MGSHDFYKMIATGFVVTVSSYFWQWVDKKQRAKFRHDSIWLKNPFGLIIQCFLTPLHYGLVFLKSSRFRAKR